MGSTTLVLGGARSGKSRFALSLASAGGGVTVYVATAEPSDAEMAERIARHRAERGTSWRTVEAPRALDERLVAEAGPHETVLIDCLSVWLSNELLLRERELQPVTGGALLPESAASVEREVLQAVDRLCRWVAARPGQTVVVSNEVGSGVVPAYPLGRLYRDILGQANQRLAASAEHVYLIVAGIGVDLRRLAEAQAMARMAST